MARKKRRVRWLIVPGNGYRYYPKKNIWVLPDYQGPYRQLEMYQLFYTVKQAKRFIANRLPAIKDFYLEKHYWKHGRWWRIYEDINKKG